MFSTVMNINSVAADNDSSNITRVFSDRWAIVPAGYSHQVSLSKVYLFAAAAIIMAGTTTRRALLDKRQPDGER
ncbi:hypothetical protein CORMATOL_01248 [Corynebacterium matruchotii ATCC 33806]|uniref:Uncharacterized protein n=1 Tax=Corynebacterium matruchotii ATCC 33806 TaxID=566549 RepID=C0E2P3_9CORY|nr:hypothetical protein CORMATOL_01248 [Corynebacterium matruchotii ATCC 33806]